MVIGGTREFQHGESEAASKGKPPRIHDNENARYIHRSSGAHPFWRPEGWGPLHLKRHDARLWDRRRDGPAHSHLHEGRGISYPLGSFLRGLIVFT